MTVTLETLAIGNRDGPRVWIVTRRVGKHLDINQVPDVIGSEKEALVWAAKAWNVPECDVKFAPLQIVEIESEA